MRRLLAQGVLVERRRVLSFLYFFFDDAEA